MNATAGMQSSREVWIWTMEKLRAQASVIRDHFPHIAQHGRYDRCSPEWWTAGFWPGLLWLVQRYDVSDTMHYDGGESLRSLAYQQVKPNALLRDWACSCEQQLERCLYHPEQVDHNLGMIWTLSGVANYEQTGDREARRRSLLAANLLAGRFNVRGGYLRAWNFESARMDTRGVTIIESLMNLPLLYWASLQTGDPRYRALAMAHADTIAREMVREDGSVCHVVEFDHTTGQRQREHAGEAYHVGSSWARGTAWALYGFTLSYAYTAKTRYLELAQRIADYFLEQLDEQVVPCWDWRAPSEQRHLIDSSATAIAASSLLELSNYVIKSERRRFQRAALIGVKGLYEQYSTRHTDDEGLITDAYVADSEQRHLHVPVIYGDYFFTEALVKLRGGQGLMTPGLQARP
ncbi:glycoside hydrolase family 88 protein [Paenibacillus kandeliae]|uniref:glycoside hydrolase family 88 protein n=1 Tax=Paenibacillus kandeliae TaxID=3231269 RepID=UPI003457AE75